MAQKSPALTPAKIDHWFITPKNKFLAGDITYRDKEGNDREEYVNNLIVQDVLVLTDAWKVQANNYIITIRRETMDGYFVKNHLVNTLDFLNNFKKSK